MDIMTKLVNQILILIYNEFQKKKMDWFDKEMMDILKTEDDEYDAYCKLLAPKLRKIATKNPRIFLELQSNINMFVNEAKINILD